MRGSVRTLLVWLLCGLAASANAQTGPGMTPSAENSTSQAAGNIEAKAGQFQVAQPKPTGDAEPYLWNMLKNSATIPVWMTCGNYNLQTPLPTLPAGAIILGPGMLWNYNVNAPSCVNLIGDNALGRMANIAGNAAVASNGIVTVTGLSSGYVSQGALLNIPGLPGDAHVVAQIGGSTGGNGTYTTQYTGYTISQVAFTGTPALMTTANGNIVQGIRLTGDGVTGHADGIHNFGTWTQLSNLYIANFNVGLYCQAQGLKLRDTFLSHNQGRNFADGEGCFDSDFIFDHFNNSQTSDGARFSSGKMTITASVFEENVGYGYAIGMGAQTRVAVTSAQVGHNGAGGVFLDGVGAGGGADVQVVSNQFQGNGWNASPSAHVVLTGTVHNLAMVGNTYDFGGSPPTPAYIFAASQTPSITGYISDYLPNQGTAVYADGTTSTALVGVVKGPLATAGAAAPLSVSGNNILIAGGAITNTYLATPSMTLGATTATLGTTVASITGLTNLGFTGGIGGGIWSPSGNFGFLISGPGSDSSTYAGRLTSRANTSLWDVRDDGLMRAYGTSAVNGVSQIGCGGGSPVTTIGLLVCGPGTTSADFALRVTSSIGTSLLDVRDDGFAHISGTLQVDGGIGGSIAPALASEVGMFPANEYGSCIWDGQSNHDIAPCISAAITAATSAGGGVVVLPPGPIYYVATPVVNHSSSVRLRGQGLGTPYDTLSTSAFLAGTKLIWNGSAAATMYDLEPANNSAATLYNVDVENIVFDCNAVAGTGFKFSQVSYSTLRVGAAECRSVNIQGSTTTTTDTPGTQHNDMWLYSRQTSVSDSFHATGILLDGGASSTWNVSYNTDIHLLWAMHGSGDGVVIGSADNNDIGVIRVYRFAGLTQYGRDAVFANTLPGYLMPNGNRTNGTNGSYNNRVFHTATPVWALGMQTGATITPNGGNTGSGAYNPITRSTTGGTVQGTKLLTLTSTGLQPGMSIDDPTNNVGIYRDTNIASIGGGGVFMVDEAWGTVATSSSVTFGMGVTSSAVPGTYTLTATSGTTFNLTAPGGGHSQTGISPTSGALVFTDLVIPMTGTPNTNDNWAIVLPTASFLNTFESVDKANNVALPSCQPTRTCAKVTTNYGAELIAGPLGIQNIHTGSIVLSVGGGLAAGFGSQLGEDPTGIFYDLTNQRLGLGTQTPAQQLHMAKAGGGSIIRMENPGNVAWRFGNPIGGTDFRMCQSDDLASSCSFEINQSNRQVSFDVGPKMPSENIGPAILVGSLPTCNSGSAGSIFVVSDFSGTPTWFASIGIGTGSTTMKTFCNGTQWVQGG